MFTVGEKMWFEQAYNIGIYPETSLTNFFF